MKTVFIIGGIGAGKSAAAQCFAEEGLPVYDLDKAGHDVLFLPEVKILLTREFGQGILDSAGAVSREALAARAFKTQQAAERLAQTTHPFILEELSRWLAAREAEGNRLAAVEASAYDGSSAAQRGFADYVVAVTAPVEVRVARAVAKGFNEDDVRRRIAAQPSDGQRRAWADFVLENAGSMDDLRRQVGDVLAEVLAQLAESGG